MTHFLDVSGNATFIHFTSYTCSLWKQWGLLPTRRGTPPSHIPPTPPHRHRDVQAFLDENLQGHWVGRRGTFEFPPRSPDLTPLDLHLCGTLKDVVYRTKPVTLGDLRTEIRAAWAAIPINNLTEVAQSTARRCNMCLAANGNHFEHLH